MRENLRAEMIRLIKTGYKTLDYSTIAEMDESIKHKLYEISKSALNASLELIDGNDDAKLQIAKSYIEPDVQAIPDTVSIDSVVIEDVVEPVVTEVAKPKRNRKK